MKCIGLLLFLSMALFGQSVREEFKRQFVRGERLSAGVFTVQPFSDTSTETSFAVSCSDDSVNYLVVEVFYIRSIIGIEGRPLYLLSRHVVTTATLAGATTLTDSAPLPITEIRMIRVTGLHVQHAEEIR